MTDLIRAVVILGGGILLIAQSSASGAQGGPLSHNGVEESSSIGPGVGLRRPVAPRVLTVTMFQQGDPRDSNSVGEATRWVQNERLDRLIDIPGSHSPLYCNAGGEHCLVITGVGKANATATLMAVGLSPRVNLTRTYVMLAGIGGNPPDAGTIGGAVWADWVVDSDIADELDAREMPADFLYPKFPLGCATQWCTTIYRTGTELFLLNPVITEWAFRLSRDVELADDAQAQAYRALYVQQAARGEPSVAKCAVASGSTFYHGTLMSAWAQWWVSQWTDGRSTYCMTAAEDSGVLTALTRLAGAGRVDMNRVMVLRASSNFDQQHPHQTADESLTVALRGLFGTIGLENAYLVGSAVSRHIIANWHVWRAGPPELP